MKFLMFDMGLFIGWFTSQLVHKFTSSRDFEVLVRVVIRLSISLWGDQSFACRGGAFIRYFILAVSGLCVVLL